jgi:hypothetical protein
MHDLWAGRVCRPEDKCLVEKAEPARRMSCDQQILCLRALHGHWCLDLACLAHSTRSPVAKIWMSVYFCAEYTVATGNDGQSFCLNQTSA